MQATFDSLIRAVLTASVLLFVSISGSATESQIPPILESASHHQPEVGRNGMVVSAEALSTRIGLDILKRGGNAVDAAVAVGFALAVTYPRAGNIGGGGFMLVYLAKEQRTIAIDYREMAPAAADRDMFLNEDGSVNNDIARFSHRSAGVPGTVAGLLYALRTYGTMTTAQVLQPAIDLAQKGFPVYLDLSVSLTRAKKKLQRHEVSRVFYDSEGNALQPGTILRQRNLARTLKRIAKSGEAGFYSGETARAMAAYMSANKGLITEQDMQNYKAVEREAVRGQYRGYEIVSMPPPSSGGVHVLQMLNILEGYPMAESGFGSARNIHWMVESMRLAYADRSQHLGDPDFHPVPVSQLTDKDYARKLRSGIGERARSSEQVKPGVMEPAPESPNTTHFSIMDRDGNAVANTYTLNFSYGSGIYASELGFFLNNEMDDFSAKLNTPNGFGLLGAEANAIQARKRPLSSMTPTIVLRDGKAVLVTGSPGGSTIITTVLQVLVNVLDYGMNVASAVAAPRFHHQWKPDMLWMEPGFSIDTRNLLEKKGHSIRSRGVWGFAGSIASDGGWYYGAADPRRNNALAVGY